MTLSYHFSAESSQIPRASRAADGVPSSRTNSSTSVPDVQSQPLTSIESTSRWPHLVSLSPQRSLAEMFGADDERHRSLVLSAGDLSIDISRQRVDAHILSSLVEAAEECDVRGALERMFSGAVMNVTEQRSVGHVALRMKPDERFEVSGVDVVREVRGTLDAMAVFADSVRTGGAKGATGHPFTTVVNIGIGGSDLGPRLIHDALGHLRHEHIETRFVSNVDPVDFDLQVSGLDPARTLFIVSSKTFTTTETLINARRATEWIRIRLGDAAIPHHMVGVSADLRAVKASGLGADIVFPLWDWVGGRFSVGSAVGLSAMIAMGSEEFRTLLDGMRDIDIHVRQSDSIDNAPLVLALVGIWNHSVLGLSSRAVIPYSHALRGFPDYLQQLVMESNGKSVRADGSPVGLATSPIIWGGEGTNAQHAFMQFLHQGTSVVPVDFIGFARPSGDPAPERARSQRVLFMNMVAQAQALAFGRNPTGGGEPHRAFAGNRPSTVITAPELTPRVLGQLIALYEHAVFYEGILLGINSFDQWGVELGKELASALMSDPAGDAGEESSAERAGKRLVEWFERHAESKSTEWNADR